MAYTGQRKIAHDGAAGTGYCPRQHYTQPQNRACNRPHRPRRQLTSIFRKCGVYVENARTGSQLIELLESKSDAIVTTIINKFETAVKGIKKPLADSNIFVLVDEGHRSQYGEMGINMNKTLPNDCLIAMTGTPLMKKGKSTAVKFGGIIQPVYTVGQAVKDGAVVPLLYEGRLVPQTVHSETIDRYFDMICGWMYIIIEKGANFYLKSIPLRKVFQSNTLLLF